MKLYQIWERCINNCQDDSYYSDFEEKPVSGLYDDLEKAKIDCFSKQQAISTEYDEELYSVEAIELNNCLERDQETVYIPQGFGIKFRELLVSPVFLTEELAIAHAERLKEKNPEVAQDFKVLAHNAQAGYPISISSFEGDVWLFEPNEHNPTDDEYYQALSEFEEGS